MDRFDEMRARIMSGGGSGTPDGFIPLPVSQFEFVQTLGVRGRGTAKFIFPEEATEVDLIVKKGRLPESLQDYDELFTLTNGNSELIFTPDANNRYAKQYGFWAVSKNDAGVQTALNATNRKLYTFLYASNALEANYSGALGSATSLFSKAVDDIIFISSSSVKGTFVLDRTTNTITQPLTSYYMDNWYIYKINENKYALVVTNNSTVGTWEYDHSTGTCKQVGSGYTQYRTCIELDDFVILGDSAGSSVPIMYKKTTDTWQVTNGYKEMSMLKTSQGLFMCSRAKR